MEARVIKLTPQLAEKYLSKNTNNRKLDDRKVAEYSQALKLGHWKENGASIVIDKNGVIKDGQHRLKSVMNTKVSYKTVLVTDVLPDVMDTIDNGKGRTLGDVLKLNGYKYSNELASITNKILSHTNNTIASSTGGGAGYGKQKVTNKMGLDYVAVNHKKLIELCQMSSKIYSKSKSKVFSMSEIGFYIHLLDGFTFSDNVVIFMKNITGINVYEGNAASWIYGKMFTAKDQKIRLNRKWIIAMVIKAWNSYNAGDPAVRTMKYNTKEPLPSVL